MCRVWTLHFVSKWTHKAEGMARHIASLNRVILIGTVVHIQRARMESLQTHRAVCNSDASDLCSAQRIHLIKVVVCKKCSPNSNRKLLGSLFDLQLRSARSFGRALFVLLVLFFSKYRFRCGKSEVGVVGALWHLKPHMHWTN